MKRPVDGMAGLRSGLQPWLGVAMVVLGPMLASCGDAPAGPSGARPAALEAAAADGQTAAPGAAVATAPAVLVRDVRGSPAAGVTVQFAVTQGGGHVTQTQVATGPDGIASAGEWRLGTSPGLNTVEARVGTLAPVRFTATATSAADRPPMGGPTAFDITVRWVGTATPRQQTAVADAVARWRTVITEDLPSVRVTAPAGECFAGQPALDETVDDLLMFVEFVDIDGPGGTLGMAGPCYIRRDSGLPLVGYMKLDATDLAQLERSGTLDDVVLHEIGHVLGIGTLWSHRGLLQGAGTADPQYHGTNALMAYRDLGGSEPGVPAENTGGAGTRDGHWRESVFGNELMTGYIGGVPNPLSELTIGSLLDLGYGARLDAAGSYSFASRFGGIHVAPVDLRGRERLLAPSHRVDPDGNREPIDTLLPLTM